MVETGLNFEITQRPDFSVLSVRLEQGQQFFSEPSAMAAMDATIGLKAGMKGGLKRALGRMLAGENLVINTYTAERGPGEVIFAPGPMGDIVHYRLDNTSIFLQSGAYLGNTPGVEVSAKWGKARGFFSGMGLVLLKAEGTGDLFFNTYGALLEIDVLGDYYVDTGNIVAFENTLDYRVTTLPGLSIGSKVKSFFFGGEGFVCQFSGQGKLWIQTRMAMPFLNFMYPYRPSSNN